MSREIIIIALLIAELLSFAYEFAVLIIAVTSDRLLWKPKERQALITSSYVMAVICAICSATIQIIARI